MDQLTRRRKSRHNAASPAAIESRERHVEWLRRKAKGETFRQIGQSEDVHPSTVHEAVHRLLAEQPVESAEEYRRVEVERLDRQLERLNDSLLTSDEPASIEALILKVGERRAKLLGLDAQKQVKVEHEFADYSDEQLLDALGKLGLKVEKTS